MSDVQLKMTIYLTLTASGILITVLLFGGVPLPVQLGTALCLWGCGLVHGMAWQFMIHNETGPQNGLTKEK